MRLPLLPGLYPGRHSSEPFRESTYRANHKGSRFATTFCDLKNHRVFNVVPDRSPRELSAYVASPKSRERVRVVCIDLSSPYRALIRKWFPNARIGADHFHVIQPRSTLMVGCWKCPIVCTA